MRRRVPSKRAGKRTAVVKKSDPGTLTLDDRPLSVALSRDEKRIIVTLPYELWIIHTETMEVERSIELPMEHPSVFEADEEGILWIGGPHLYRSSLWTTTATKVGSRLGGFVDGVCLLRPTLLCGVGTHGEVLLDTEEQEVVHRRKASERTVHGLTASTDARGVFADGSPTAWVIDPEHLSGYMRLQLKATSAHQVTQEGLVQVGTTREGRCVLGARDGGVAWTNKTLRMDGERFPDREHGTTALAVTGDEWWAYVLRPAGALDRFSLRQPEPTDEDPEPTPLAQAQTCRLDRVAHCMTLGSDGVLLLAGPHADGQLGRLWKIRPSQLQWEDLPLRGRSLVEHAEQEQDQPARPPFVATRTKIKGPPLRELRVDDVLAGSELHITRSQGSLLDRPITDTAPEKVKPGDALLLPAMIRFHEGTARPALLLWPGLASEDTTPPEPLWLTWGDQPQGWMPLRTPEIRAQGWTRRDVFPLQVALAYAPPAVPGNRAAIPGRWSDSEQFLAMARECKKLLKVLW